MISFKHRFHGLNSLRHVYKNGQTVRSPMLAIRSIQHTNRPDYRLAVVVSKKVSKSAVKRNRMRRRLYEIVRKNESAIVVPADIVITVFSDEVGTVAATTLEATVLKLLKQAKITS